jgi:predicted GNAT family acetyltransferase
MYAMKLKRYKSAAELAAVISPLLQQDEVRYGLVAGLLDRLITNPRYYGDTEPWFLTAEEKGIVLSLALRTPPHNVVLAHFSGDPGAAVKLLADAIARFSPGITGVSGESNSAEPFVTHWCRSRGVRVSSRMLQNIYRLDRINEVSPAAGKCRLAVDNDISWLPPWLRAFQEEVFPESTRADPAVSIGDRIAHGDIFVWDDGGPVSIAAKSWGTARGRAVGPVYTPSQFRRRGYATACVSAVCRDILASRYEYCVLYADQANPVSNSIYKKIGFVEVGDAVMYGFTGGASEDKAR